MEDLKENNEALPLRTSEAAALAVACALDGKQVFCVTIGRGQAARTLAAQRPDAHVTLVMLDLFQHQLVVDEHLRQGGQLAGTDLSAEARTHGLAIYCTTDVPRQAFDLAIVPCTVRGEAELTRDWLQQAFEQLDLGGRLVASVDHPQDRWLHEQMNELASKVSVTRTESASVYVAIKREPLKRARRFDCEFTYRDRGQTITAFSRPGVFSHRRLDAGAKALLDQVDVAAGDRVFDVGCGAGTVSLALSRRVELSHVLAIDSNARAVQCAAEGARRNDLLNYHALLCSDGRCDQPSTYDLAVCNPPYYGNFRIANLFLDAAHRALRPGGVVAIVTKQPDVYAAAMPIHWADVAVNQGKLYSVITARR